MLVLCTMPAAVPICWASQAPGVDGDWGQEITDSIRLCGW
jgi:hypothetical protein